MEGIDLEDVAVFARVVQAGSFSAAARALAAPKSSVSRRVARLEQRLGVRLLQRTPRALTLTEAGRAYYERVAAALATMADAAQAAVDAREVPSGLIRVTAPPDVGAEVLPELVARFLVRHPEVRIDVDLTPDASRLIEGGYDVAIRVGRQPDSRLVIRRLQETDFRLYAAPAYLARAGTPARPDELASHACVLFHARRGKARWKLRGRRGEVEVNVQGAVSANDMSFVRRATIAGCGIALLPEVVGTLFSRTGELQPVLPGYHVEGLPLHLAYPSAQHLPLRVRLFMEFLLEHFPRAGPLSGGPGAR